MHTTTTSTTATTSATTTKPTTTAAATIAALAVGAGLLLAACGSDTQALTKPDFIAQANAICQETQDRIEPIFESIWADTEDIDFDDPENQTLLFARWDEALDEVVPIVEQQLDDIRDLAAPEGDEELIETLLDDQEAAIETFTAQMSAAADGDESAMAALEDDDPFEDIDRRAREYGLTVCGNNE